VERRSTASDVFSEVYRDFPRDGPGRNQYTRKAFRMLPVLKEPRILDIGCGPGGPTLELARLSGGHVVGIDVHGPYLDRLRRKIEQTGLSGRVTAVNCSLFEMSFPGASFDVVWAEGSIYLIGFQRGLREWQRLIKPDGFLVVHEMAWLRPEPPQEIREYWKQLYPGITTVAENLDLVSRCGYDLVGHFALPEDAWWTEYYGPLEDRIRELRMKYVDDARALAVLHEEQQEVEMYRKYHRWYGSAFFVMQKT
jgi:ubiquinone/menaquinone biosynthesis C-methylase UbiE